MKTDKCRKLRDKIATVFVDELRQSSFYQVDFRVCVNRCLKELGERKISQIICYGLGSFHNGVDVVSRYQLALLILLHEHLLEYNSTLSSVIEVYDPSFEQLDKDTLMAFTRPQFNLISINEYCARKLEFQHENRCSLVYMPHLDKFLYNNLLGANWKIENLSQLVILGNSFTEMIDNEIPSKRRSELHFMNQLVNNFQNDEKTSIKARGKGKSCSHHEHKHQSDQTALVEIPLDDSTFEHKDVFNSLAFHFISKAWIQNDGLIKIQQNSLPNWTYVTSCSMEG